MPLPEEWCAAASPPVHACIMHAPCMHHACTMRAPWRHTRVAHVYVYVYVVHVYGACVCVCTMETHTSRARTQRTHARTCTPVCRCTRAQSPMARHADQPKQQLRLHPAPSTQCRADQPKQQLSVQRVLSMLTVTSQRGCISAGQQPTSVAAERQVRACMHTRTCMHARMHAFTHARIHERCW